MDQESSSGVRVYCTRLKAALENAGHEVRLVTPSCAPRLARWVTGAFRRGAGWGGPCPNLIASELKCWGRIFAATRALHWKPDIVHAQDPGSASAVRMALGAAVPMVVTCHFNENLADEALNQAGIPGAAAAGLRRWHAWTFRQTWNWIAVSRYAAECLRRYIPAAAPIRVIHNGVDFSAAKVCADPLITQRYNGLVRILNVGSLESRKNQILILAVAECLRELPVQFLLAGEGPDKGMLEQVILQRGLKDKVCFLGYRRDILSVMRACDIYLHVAKRENCPFVILEALAAGLPVMSVASGGIRELLETTAERVLIEDSASPQTIADRLSAWIRQPELREVLICGQYEYAVAQFSSESVLKKTELCYQEILNDTV